MSHICSSGARNANDILFNSRGSNVHLVVSYINLKLCFVEQFLQMCFVTESWKTMNYVFKFHGSIFSSLIVGQLLSIRLTKILNTLLLS